MGWPQLTDILNRNRGDIRAFNAAPPTACPIDGSMLQDRGNVRNCPMGNYTWPEGTSVTSPRT